MTQANHSRSAFLSCSTLHKTQKLSQTVWLTDKTFAEVAEDCYDDLTLHKCSGEARNHQVNDHHPWHLSAKSSPMDVPSKPAKPHAPVQDAPLAPSPCCLRKSTAKIGNQNCLYKDCTLDVKDEAALP